MFWVYGPSDGEITVVGLEPHPEDRKSRGYDRVSLSNLPPLVPPSPAEGQPSGDAPRKPPKSRRRKQ